MVRVCTCGNGAEATKKTCQTSPQFNFCCLIIRGEVILQQLGPNNLEFFHFFVDHLVLTSGG